MSDLESRIKALEEKLTPDPLKISTMKATNLLKQYLDEKKVERESQEDVMWRIIEQAERVPELEKRIQELEKKQLSKDEAQAVFDSIRDIDLCDTEDKGYTELIKSAIEKLRIY